MFHVMEPAKLNQNRDRPDIQIQVSLTMSDYAHSFSDNGAYLSTAALINSYTGKVYLDLQIANPFTDFGIRCGSSSTIFAAGKAAEVAKFKKYIGRYPDLVANNYRFYPIIVETTGGMNIYLRQILTNIGKKKAARVGKHLTLIMAELYFGLGEQLRMAVIRSIRERYLR
jgi:hypothetical protein